ncbi:MAG TPA: zf-HC2 domain-containing protein [Archangium sp.]|uniref:zf-HC2 domain-containing protein n=1 Tax=Archangium sp. TaxID=1872627 RepID=UPI002E35C8A1|nr:zf-HC2 domain-containing protein [Archangium sp.]HEX5746789.1 zf-HC2 domain-containing protein [Archangium sp.]
MSPPPSPHLSTLTLDALHLGGLSPEEERQARAHLAECEDCTRRLTTTSSSALHFQQALQQQTLEQMRARLERPRSHRTRPALRWVLLALGATALAVGAVLARMGGGD